MYSFQNVNLFPKAKHILLFTPFAHSVIAIDIETMYFVQFCELQMTR